MVAKLLCFLKNAIRVLKGIAFLLRFNALCYANSQCAYRLWWLNSKYDLLTSVWPSRSKIGRGQKVGQSKTFSNHGLWHTKMTGLKSRMQNCHSCLPNFPRFSDIRHFVLSQCYPIGQIDKVQCQLFQQWTHFNGSLVHWYILTHDPFIPWGQSWPWPLTLETRSPDVQNT